MSDFQERLIGGVVSVGMTRTIHSFKNSFYLQTGGPVGYGIYLTDRRLIGVSFQKTVSRAYCPAYILFLTWIVSLTALVAYAIVTGAEQSILLPFVMALVFVDLGLLIYWSPKQASARLERERTIRSVEELEKKAPDVVLNRGDIAHVTVRPGLLTVTMKASESQTFLTKLRGNKMSQLLRLFQSFCSATPLIEMAVSDASGSKVRKIVEPASSEGREGWITIQRPLSGREERVWMPRKLTYEEAENLPSAYAILEGEFGYQCYLTAPLPTVNCKEAGLRQLLVDLDSICCNDHEGRHIRYEQHESGDLISDGMCGGRTQANPWIHPQLVDFGLEDRIRAVLSGGNARLVVGLEEASDLRARWRDPEENSKYKGY